MRNSQLPTRDWTLDDLPAGVRARVVAVDPGRRALLASHGVHPGVGIEVDLDAPFGGPRIVRLGFARLAVARAVARAVQVSLEAAEPANAAEPTEPTEPAASTKEPG